MTSARGFGEIAEQLRRSTVQVAVGGRDRGGGSGVIWSRDGLIVTNAHVARRDRLEVELWDGRRFDARVEARDATRDLAALRITATGLPAALAGDSAALRPGELVIAIGNPLGFAGALSTGSVHSVGPVRGMGQQSWVRAGVRLAPGNSGGPLANAEGRVVGINTAVLGGGMGLAVPSNAVIAFLRKGSRPRLGVAMREVELGLLLVEVMAGGAADRASLWVSDILTAADGKRLRATEDLIAAIDAAGATLDLEFVRGDRSRRRHAVVALEARKAEAA